MVIQIENKPDWTLIWGFYGMISSIYKRDDVHYVVWVAYVKSFISSSRHNYTISFMYIALKSFLFWCGYIYPIHSCSPSLGSLIKTALCPCMPKHMQSLHASEPLFILPKHRRYITPRFATPGRQMVSAW